MTDAKHARTATPSERPSVTWPDPSPLTGWWEEIMGLAEPEQSRPSAA
ncbi:hypothetical protein [Nocardia aurea]|uniref:Uncharacterized protein n=1 Tax=Nocardia aurea TaxID=2144174 RepID=A0ABV3FSH0_9NOCA